MFTSLTTHNLHFHEDASIYCCSSKDNLLATGGGDSMIRIWKLDYTNTKKEFNYYTALNSPLKITYLFTLVGHTKTVNSLEFYNEYLISTSDSGEVFLWPTNDFKENKYFKIKGGESDEANCALMTDQLVYVGMKSGRLMVYEYKIDQRESISDKSDICMINTLLDETSYDLSLIYKSKENENNIDKNDNEIINENNIDKKENNIDKNENINNIENNNNIIINEIINNNITKTENIIKTDNINNTNINKTENIIINENDNKNKTKKKINFTVLPQESSFSVKLIKSLKLHSDSIQGMCINTTHSVLFTQSKDKSIKIFDLLTNKVINTLQINKLKIENNSLKEIMKEDLKLDFSDRSFFKRISCIDDKIYLTNVSLCKKNVLVSLGYPYKEVCDIVGVFNWPVQKIIKINDRLVVCTNKSVYLVGDKCEMFGNVGYGTMTDGCLIDEGVIFTNSDGFVYSFMM